MTTSLEGFDNRTIEPWIREFWIWADKFEVSEDKLL